MTLAVTAAAFPLTAEPNNERRTEPSCVATSGNGNSASQPRAPFGDDSSAANMLRFRPRGVLLVVSR